MMKIKTIVEFLELLFEQEYEKQNFSICHYGTTQGGMAMKTRILVLCLVILLSFQLMVSVASAVDYPKKPVTLVVPYPAGGRTDMATRIFVQVLPKYLKQPAVVVNKPGAGSVLGTMEVMKSDPDGYTLGVFSNALVASHYVLPDTIQLWKGVETVAMFNFDGTIMVASKKSGVGNLKELIAFAKNNPNKLSVGINQGTATSLYTYTFMKIAGIDVTYVPFKGGGEAKVALAGGHIDVHFDAAYIYKPLVDADKAKFMGISSERRDIFHPDIPTFKEQGVDITWGAWNGVFAPKGTSPEVIQILEKAIESTANDKEFSELMKKNQLLIEYRNRQNYSNFLEKEDRVYREISTEIGIYKPKK